MPTDAEIIRVSEKELIGGYSCVKTRMAFDTEIFLNDSKNEKVPFKTGWAAQTILIQNNQNG